MDMYSVPFIGIILWIIKQVIDFYTQDLFMKDTEVRSVYLIGIVSVTTSSVTYGFTMKRVEMSWIVGVSTFVPLNHK
jgi:hypothetical protein